MSNSSGQTQPGLLERLFTLSERKSSVRQEVLAGLTTFLAMVYSIVVVPSLLGQAGFPVETVFVATCLVAGLGSIVMGLWANLPMAIGCAISLTAFTAFSLVLGQGLSIPVVLGAVFVMGVLFTLISATGIRAWILRNIPMGIAHGTGIGIGLFLLMIATSGIGAVVKNPNAGLPVQFGDFTSFPVMMAFIGLAVIIGLERLRVPGGILIVIVAISGLGLAFDPNVKYQGFSSMPSLVAKDGTSLIFSLDILGALFLLLLFFSPLASLVPAYATAPALMYVGLLMLSNVAKLDFDDFVDAMSGLVCAVFIVLTSNIVTGIMLGFATLVIGRVFSGEWRKLNVSIVLIAAALVAFYAGGWAI